jgi:hypothetical protein
MGRLLIALRTPIAVRIECGLSTICDTQSPKDLSKFSLRSVGGKREKWSAGGETAGTEPERNAAVDPLTEAAATLQSQLKSGRAGGTDLTARRGAVLSESCRVVFRPFVLASLIQTQEKVIFAYVFFRKHRYLVLATKWSTELSQTFSSGGNLRKFDYEIIGK